MQELNGFNIRHNGDVVVNSECPSCGTIRGTFIKAVYLSGIAEASEIAQESARRISELMAEREMPVTWDKP